MRSLFKIVTLSAAVVACSQSLANDYPNKPIRALVGYPPGGSVDYIARIISQPLAEALGQPLVIENKPGADGTLVAAEVARSPADGYTLLFIPSQQAVNQHFYKTSYDTMKSFDYLSELVSTPLLLATARSSPINSVSDLIKVGNSRESGLTYGSTGAGSFQHLAAFVFAQRAKTPALHIPYKGGGPMLTATMSGEVDFVFTSLSLVISQVKEGGKLKPLAVAGTSRSPVLPDVPTVAETVPGVVANNWIGLVGPANLPGPVKAKLTAALRKVLANPQVKARLVSEGWQIVASTPEAFQQHMKTEVDFYGDLIRKNGIKAQ